MCPHNTSNPVLSEILVGIVGKMPDTQHDWSVKVEVSLCHGILILSCQSLHDALHAEDGKVQIDVLLLFLYV